MAGDQQRKIGDAANIEHHTALDRIHQQRLMKRGHQRRTLPAQRHIAAAEVADHGDAGGGDNLIIIADLQRVRRVALRFVPDGLPVTADSDNIARLQRLAPHQSIDRVGEQSAKARIELAELRKR